MEWDALLLSRLQFAFTIGFHIIFPAFTIGLASFLAVLEGLWLFTKRPLFKNLYLFWVKIFAISFGMGVVSGVVMSYQFGTNWSVFATQVGSVIGPLLGYEVLTAFSWKPLSSALCCSAGNAWGRGFTSLRRALSRWARSSARSGFSPPIPGCRRRKGSRLRLMAR